MVHCLPILDSIVGFCHEWKSKGLNASEWAHVTENLTRLTAGVPDLVTQARKSRMIPIISRLVNHFSKDPGFRPGKHRTELFDADKVIIQPGDDGAYWGASEFEFSREAHTGWVRSNAAVYDFLAIRRT